MLAERQGQTGQVADLLSRLELYDPSGERKRRWSAPALVNVTTTPPGANVVLETYTSSAEQRRVATPTQILGPTPVAEVELPAGSYRLSFEMPGRVAVRYPFVVARGETFLVEVHLPRAEELPEGFVYVPAGRSFYGSNDIEEMRQRFFLTDPLHHKYTAPYLVAQHETTVGEYLEFLTTLTPEQRLLRAPPASEIGLTQISDTVWEYRFPQGDESRVARSGTPIHLRGTDGTVLVDWTRLPISGLTWDDADAYLSWLGDTGRVPGARFCSEYEWERAARGADDRKYPHGDSITNGDANFAKGHDMALMAVAPVGSFPLSVSPFGLHDTTGNVFEWVSSIGAGDQRVARSSTYLYDQISARLINRTTLGPDDRVPRVGLRVCASYSPRS